MKKCLFALSLVVPSLVFCDMSTLFHRYIDHDMLLSAVWLTRSDKSNENKQRIENAALAKLKDDHTSLPSQLYYESVLSLLKTDISSARNNWYRYLRLMEAINPESQGPHDREVKKFYRWAEEQRKLALSQLPEADSVNPPDPNPSPVPLSKRIPLQHLRRQPVVQIDPQANIRDVLNKARLAEDNGHYERAYDLYRLAHQLDPSSEDIRNQLARMSEILEP